MANYQEILTKAVVGKGKKTCIDSYLLESKISPSKVLGCWVINHIVNPVLKNTEVYAEGEFEVHIWYAYDDDKNTELHKEKITYSELIPFKMKKGELEIEFSSDDADFVEQQLEKWREEILKKHA